MAFEIFDTPFTPPQSSGGGIDLNSLASGLATAAAVALGVPWLASTVAAAVPAIAPALAPIAATSTTQRWLAGIKAGIPAAQTGQVGTGTLQGALDLTTTGAATLETKRKEAEKDVQQQNREAIERLTKLKEAKARLGEEESRRQAFIRGLTPEQRKEYRISPPVPGELGIMKTSIVPAKEVMQALTIIPYNNEYDIAVNADGSSRFIKRPTLPETADFKKQLNLFSSIKDVRGTPVYNSKQAKTLANASSQGISIPPYPAPAGKVWVISPDGRTAIEEIKKAQEVYPLGWRYLVLPFQVP